MTVFFRSALILLIAVASLSVGACKKKSDTNSTATQTTVTVKKAPIYSNLYFSGNLMPFKFKNVTSPTEGAVTQQTFKYGQVVKKGQLLYVIDSSKQAQAFSSALSDYLKAKNTYNQSATTLQNNQKLWENQLIPRDTYTQSQDAYYLDRLSLLKAQDSLSKAMKHYKTDVDVFSLSISDINKVTEALKNAAEFNTYHIYAPAYGVALFPIESSGSGDSDSKKVKVGSQVKQGQLLVSIGEFKGLALSAKASEIEINKLKPGMKVTVTSVALPDVTLNGVISSVDFQASDTSNIPQFSITIAIPKIPEKYLSEIRIGMSAKAAVQIAGPPQIQIPITAIKQDPKTGQAYVEVLDSAGTAKRVDVTAGATNVDSVVILSGLKPGDKVVTTSSNSS